MRTTIDLFAGAGGASLGLRNAGFHHNLCIEWDEDAASTLVAAGLPGVHGDVRELSHYDNLEHVDLMWASPPCQAFSHAGKRKGPSDERNGWPWTLDVIDHLHSRGIGQEWVICENVPGMTYHSVGCGGLDAFSCLGCYWEKWIQPEFRKRFSWVGTVVLNAVDFGVPQQRKRLFLVAGPKPIAWPQKTHCSPSSIRQRTMFGPKLKPWVTINEALGIDSKIIGICSNPSKRDEHGEWDHASRTYKDITNEPSTGITAAGPLWNQGPFVVEGEEKRRLTWRECSILQGFPDDYPFEGKTQVSLYKQAGNAVCPVVSEVLGQCVMTTMIS